MRKTGIGKAKLMLHRAKHEDEKDEQDAYYMSKAAYERIMNYQPEMAALDQRHLRSAEEIKALQSRLEGIKKELQYMVDKELLILAENEAQMREGYQKTMENIPAWFQSTYYDKKLVRSEGLDYGRPKAE
ncbi:MAG: hypothetical protein IKO11_01690 [Lachnospiraceae bacterium]|nr:hypothetical protein [Lachnospiraceae bacterium]